MKLLYLWTDVARLLRRNTMPRPHLSHPSHPRWKFLLRSIRRGRISSPRLVDYGAVKLWCFFLEFFSLRVDEALR